MRGAAAEIGRAQTLLFGRFALELPLLAAERDEPEERGVPGPRGSTVKAPEARREVPGPHPEVLGGAAGSRGLGLLGNEEVQAVPCQPGNTNQRFQLTEGGHGTIQWPHPGNDGARAARP